jgi:hypothetical protein
LFELVKLNDYVKEKNTDAIKYLIETHNLKIENGKLKCDGDVKHKIEYLDKRQLVKKIVLN